jgi:hypothetical protein
VSIKAEVKTKSLVVILSGRGSGRGCRWWVTHTSAKNNAFTESPAILAQDEVDGKNAVYLQINPVLFPVARKRKSVVLVVVGDRLPYISGKFNHLTESPH